jgi:hypothetical protein
LARIQYLPAHEKDQIQDIRNWVQSDLEATTRSAPESPVIGLIENSTAVCRDAGTSGTSKEPNPEAPKLTPSAATKDTSTAAEIGNGGAKGSRNPAVRVVPFKSLPQSAQEEIGKVLFEDPLLSIDNIKKLANCMQWSFKYTKVGPLLILYIE